MGGWVLGGWVGWWFGLPVGEWVGEGAVLWGLLELVGRSVVGMAA